MSPKEIARALKAHQLKLSADEALYLQQNILKRAPSIAECYLCSICQQENISYKSVKWQMPAVEKKIGIIFIAKDRYGMRYGLALHHSAFSLSLLPWPYEIAAKKTSHVYSMLCATGAEVLGLGSQISLGNYALPKVQRFFDSIIRGVADFTPIAYAGSMVENLHFDQCYNQNFLLSQVAVGAIKESDIVPKFAPENADNYVLVLVGASFSIPNALLACHLAKAHEALFDILKKKKLLNKIGLQAIISGGIALASAKLASEYHHGVTLDIDKIPVDKENLSATDILCSDTTEGYLFAIPDRLVDDFTQHYNETFSLAHIAVNSAVTVIGEFMQGGDLKVYAKGDLIIELPMAFLMTGMSCQRSTKSARRPVVETDIAFPEDLNDILLKLLAHENVANQAMAHQYFMQPANQTLAQVGLPVIRPFHRAKYPTELHSLGVVFSLAQNTRYFEIDPYWGAINVLAKAVRTVAAQGAYPQVLTQCFNVRHPKNPFHRNELNEMRYGMANACKELHLNTYPDLCIPVLSQEVSFDHAASSATVGCLGVINDADHVIPQAFKQAGSYILLVGERRDECGGSLYYQLHQQLGARLPRADMRELEKQMGALTSVIQQRLVLSARAIIEGGIAVCLAKMAIPNQLGMLVDIVSDLPEDRLLFSETGGFVLEVLPENVALVEKIFSHHQVASMLIGEVTATKRLSLQNVINLSVEFVEKAWREGLQEKML